MWLAVTWSLLALSHSRSGSGCPNHCSLNGHCSATGTCNCLPGWTGPQCAQLKQGRSHRIWPSPTAEQSPSAVAASWGAGLVGPVPNGSQQWHLWVDTLCLTNPHNASDELHCSHTNNAMIVHATADQPTGPYEFADIAVEPSANNPAAVYHAQSGLYLLYYLDMGNPKDFSPPIPDWARACTGASMSDSGSIAHFSQLKGGRSNSSGGNVFAAEFQATHPVCTGAGSCERVAIQYSSSPSGPWQKLTPLLSAADPPGGGGRQSVIANPSPLVLANGSVMMVYRYNPPSGQPAGETIAVAIAQTWNGTYELIADNITNAAVEPGRFLTTDNATGILGDSPSLLGSAPEREVWWTQQWPQQKWRVNCSNMCTGNNSWSGLAACRDATVVSANYLDQFEEQNAPFACYQAAKGDNRAEDPWLFQNELGFHIVFHQYNQSDTVTGGHLFSEDGYSWSQSTEATYDVSMRYANGTFKRVDHRERPTLFTSADGKGTPELLITGVEVGSKSGNFPHCFSETALTEILR